MKQALAKALEAQGYTSLTAVQEAVTAPELIGKDMLVSAQTGSGKTLGFGLAIAPGLFGEGETLGQAGAPLALVIAPTRELALQVKRELTWLFAHADAVLASTVGGMDMRDERRALERGAHIVVATPGRLRDHIMRGSIDLGALKAVVLDEADEMLDLGFREDLEFILDQAPKDRQTLMFSATVPADIAKLAQNYQKNAQRIATTTGHSQHADIDYRALSVSARDSENAIINVLRYYEAPNAIVFCNTRAMVNRLTTRLSNRGFSVVALSGELSQNERTHALQAMRDGRARVCVATDVAARGIDLPNLELVVHAELPTNQDTLLHRSGRTGRAGRKGVSALIVPPVARRKAERLLGWAKVRAEWAEAPSAEEVTAMDDERMLASSDWSDEVEASNREAVDRLTGMFSAEQLAAAYVRLYRERRSAPEDLSDPAQPAAPRAEFGPSVWFSLEGGRAAEAEPRRILPMLCKLGNLSREDIGAIRIQSDSSNIQIRQAAVEGFLKAIGPGMTLEGGAVLKRLADAPEPDRAPRPARPARPAAPDRAPRPARQAAPDPAARPAQEAAPSPAPRPAGEPAPEHIPRPAPEAAPDRKPMSAAAPRADTAPRPAKPPRAERPPRWEKPAFSKPAGARHGEATDTSKRLAPRGGAAAKPGGKKPGPGTKSSAPWKARRDDKPGADAPRAEPWKPRKAKPAARPHGASSGPDASPRGAPPPTGKPSSKKNRARQAEQGGATGGMDKPRKPRVPKPTKPR